MAELRWTAEALAWLEDIRDDPHHRAREALDSMLGRRRTA